MFPINYSITIAYAIFAGGGHLLTSEGTFLPMKSDVIT